MSTKKLDLAALMEAFMQDLPEVFFMGPQVNLEVLEETMDFFFQGFGPQVTTAMLTQPENFRHVYLKFLPTNLPVFPEEAVASVLALKHFYHTLFRLQLLSKERYQEFLLLLQEQQGNFLEAMSQFSVWSEEKVAVLNAIVEDSDLVSPDEDLPYVEKRKSIAGSNVIAFPGLIKPADKQEVKAPIFPGGFQVRIDLADSKPPIWRRLLLPGDLTYETLHQVIQTLFAWDDDHLYLFHAGDRLIRSPYTEPFGELKESIAQEAWLAEDFHKLKKVDYLYDFGADWQLTIKIEKILTAAEVVTVPQCVKGKGVAPLENGKVPTTTFDLEAVNRKLAKIGEDLPF